MKILVAGGAGYIGGALTDILLNTNHDVRVYDALLFEEEYLKDVSFVYGDIRDKKLLKQQLDWADAVVWFAALVGDG
ncbi:MAG: NAD-dependent epimerase/dehydratase family protein, partial [Candidatus Saccharimonadales bacterium]